MAKYRKKAVIEATQFNYIDGIDGPDTHKLAESLGLSQNAPQSVLWEIHTPKGWMQVYNGDWLIKGNLYPCNPHIFEATYEPVEQECEHEWINAQNEVVRDGKYCRKCNIMRSDLNEGG